MPVQSKSASGREKKPPPTPRAKPTPKPILKNRRTAWDQNGIPMEDIQSDMPQSPSSTNRFSLQARPLLQGPRPFTTPPSSPTVQFKMDNDKGSSLRSHDQEIPWAALNGIVRDNVTSKRDDVRNDITHNRHGARSDVIPKRQNVFSREDILTIRNDVGASRDDGTADTDLSTISEASVASDPKQNHKYSRSGGARISFCGIEALKECEEHTDWINEILKRNNLPLISDLRTSIGDGHTLPTILEIISGVPLHCIKSKVSTKEDRLKNLTKCLEFLRGKGADVSHIDQADLEDGSLKTSLLLVGSVRKLFESSYKPHQNGHANHIDSHSSSDDQVRGKPPPLPPRTMPGATKLTGAVPTPFLAGRDTLQRTRQSLSTSPPRKSHNQNEELLPGVLGREQVNHDQNNKPHTALISTTELGTNGVAQHGVEERRQHLASTSPGPNRGILLRHPNAKSGAPVVQEMTMPQGVTRAWTGSPRPQAQNGTANNGGGSVEDRLRQLISSQNKNGGSNQGHNNQGHYNGGGLFHGGGSEVFDDGDILVVPPPQSRDPRNSPDFDLMMMGNNGYGPGYRHPGQSPRGQRSHGYVPSRPGEKQQGARADVLFSPPSPSRQRQGAAQYQRQSSGPAAPETLPPGMAQGHDNHGFSKEDAGNHGNRTKTLPNRPMVQARTSGPPRAGANNDLRNACHKLYGRPPQSGQVSPGPGVLARGDNLRSSYGHQQQMRSQQSPSPYRRQQVSPNNNMYNRPVSAPAPAQMQVHFQGQGQGHYPGQNVRASQEHLDNNGRSSHNTSAQRESPMGQSSSTQGQLEDSTSSHQSGQSFGQGHTNGPSSLPLQSSHEGFNNKSMQSPSLSPTSPQSSGSHNFAIGPAAKYPEHNSRPSSARKLPEPVDTGRSHYKDNVAQEQKSWDGVDRGAIFKGHNSTHPNNQYIGDKNRNSRFADDLTTALQAASKSNKTHFINHNKSYDRMHERSLSHDQSHDYHDQSIFDYEASHSETSGSVTPPLPPLSPTNTPPDSPISDMVPPLPRSFSATNVSSGDKLGELDHVKSSVDSKKPRRTSELQFRMDRKPHSKKINGRPGFKSKGANLRDVRESGTESDLSFDIENTILTVESHDTEQPHPAGDILTSHETAALRQQLHDLEFKYNDLKSKVAKPGQGHNHPGHHGYPQGPGPPPIGRQRRWSIGSSDTSSFRRESKFKPGKQIQHKHHSREFKNINKRFQRLESHVVTLARSVAHLSSELRTHNTMVHDIDSIKKELREVRDNPSKPFPNMLAGLDENRARDWVPGLTNPKRVNKLTKFFGEEPPLLDMFLQKLGYERYIPNFQTEHIGMIELPYMTEDRLEKIGVPMGPRIRILQEAQSCFKHENINVYMV